MKKLKPMKKMFRNLVVFIPFLTTFSSGTSYSESLASGPCDIFESGGTPCVAAHSMVRALFAHYTGALYQVLRTSDNNTLDIGILPSGTVNASQQDSFCSGFSCVVQIIYDQVRIFMNTLLFFQEYGGEG